METPEVRAAELFDTRRAVVEAAADCAGGFMGRGGLNAGPLRRAGLEEDAGGILLVGIIGPRNALGVRMVEEDEALSVESLSKQPGERVLT